ncbi:hypothetical protein BDR03DRAFT_1028389 [Suillus americanus]|nr:hypothetical protein BDR03DRAFT_1028389 [Suillus americanus]
MGERHHIGFTVAWVPHSSRFSWGIQGAYFPVIISAFICAFSWDNLQAYWGGQAVAVRPQVLAHLTPFHIFQWVTITSEMPRTRLGGLKPIFMQSSTNPGPASLSSFS